MSQQPNLPQSVGPLSVGNVVSAGLRIYRDRFKLYYVLALRAYLWILIPVYGWAKFAAMQGEIARLAFGEVIERPETATEVHRQVNPRLWNFFLAGLLIWLIFFGAYILTIFAGIIAAVILGSIVPRNPFSITILVLLALGAFIVVIFGYIWLFSRLSLVELPIAIEEQGDPLSAISRSWILTQGYALRLQLIFLVAFLVTIPVSFLVQLVTTFIQIILEVIFSSDSPIFLLFYVLASLAISFASGAFLIPFWQAIKAVIYYDLRSRKEGLDLHLSAL